MAHRAKKAQWPRIYQRAHRSGEVGYGVDLGLINGKRDRRSFKTKQEAETFAEQARVKRQNEGMAGFTLSHTIRMDAAKAHAILGPAGVSLEEAAKHYRDSVLAFRHAPDIAEIVGRMIADAERNERRGRTVSDLRSRLSGFAEDFPGRKLRDLTLEDLRDWLDGEEWAPRTRINYLTKLSQLYNYAMKNGWTSVNLAERIDRPSVEDGEPGILTIEQARRLLENAAKFDLLAYISIGLFAGLRSAELLRLQVDAVNLKEKVVVVGQSVAKKRSRRVVEICPVLEAWLGECPLSEGPIVAKARFRERLDDLRTAARILIWPHNALRHSFGSYHLAFHGDAIKTAHQMGHRDSSIIHNHYKALVLKSEAEKFWALRPKETELGTEAKPARKLVLG